MAEPLSKMQVPQDLMLDATGHLNNPLLFGMPLSTFGEDAPEWVVRSVLSTLADWLADEEVQAQIAAYLDDCLTTAPVLPADPYERRMHLGLIAEAVAYVFGVR